MSPDLLLNADEPLPRDEQNHLQTNVVAPATFPERNQAISTPEPILAPAKSDAYELIKWETSQGITGVIAVIPIMPGSRVGQISTRAWCKIRATM